MIELTKEDAIIILQALSFLEGAMMQNKIEKEVIAEVEEPARILMDAITKEAKE